ncbi:MAG: DUF4912 domain-containing protein [Nitrospiraceae bacterium]|nr:DUF4912 domain-containing protein [Nitrospiraceae bacterium]
MRKTFSRERLREVIWDIGQGYPMPPRGDAIALLMVSPGMGHVAWHVSEQSAADARSAQGGAFAGAPLIARVYDVTDIIFDGTNAHMFFDLGAGKTSGNCYFSVGRQARNYLAEIGLRNNQGMFYPLSRSNTAFFDRDRPSGNYQTAGLFVGSSPGSVFPVENIFHAPVYESMNHQLAGRMGAGAFSVAAVFLEIVPASGFGGPLGHFIADLSMKTEKFARVRLFSSPLRVEDGLSDGSLLDAADELSASVLAEVRDAHGQRPFHIVHCHDWYSATIGLAFKEELGLPMVLTLHSTEPERLAGNEMSGLSLSILRREKEAVSAADLVIVPRPSTRQQVIDTYGAPPEKVVVVPDVLDEKAPDAPRDSAAGARGWFGLNREAPTALFAGEICHASGADILVDALPTVCRGHQTAQFIFAGEGPLRQELERRVFNEGIGHRCRFLGDVPRETFDAVLGASDFVVIPSRTGQDEGLARAAIERGRPVLTTRQAGINCVVHGENGLVTFDNPGSIVWGIQEMLHNPLQGGMIRFAARKRAGEALTVEIAALRHYMHYEMLLMSERMAPGDA